MRNSIENEMNSVVYRSNDRITNFKIRVKLERLTSNALLPSLPRLKLREDLLRLIDNSKVSDTGKALVLDPTNPSHLEDVTIRWQEKLFNRLEFEHYGRDFGPTKTALEQRYFDEIRKMKVNQKQPGRIFTYIEGDPSCLPKELDTFMTDSPNEEPSQLAIGIDTIRKRRTAQSRFNSRNTVNERPTHEELRMNHMAGVPYQTMYIMADLSDRIEQATAHLVLLPQSINEHVLCKIKVYSNGALVLEPDFNSDRLAYIIETGSFHNEVYQYYLEHASIQIPLDDLLKEKQLFREISSRQKRIVAEIIGNEFDSPPPNVLKLNVFGEIVSGTNFDYDNIYVYYCLDLPDDWYAEPSVIFSGYTQTGQTTSSSKYDDIVYYSYPFEFELWYKPQTSSELRDYEFPRMPKIYFQVASHDTWGRHRTEGYTYIDIPSFPGFYNEHLSCWRPRGSSIFNELRRFFIGGSDELEDLSYVATPKEHQNDKNKQVLSRFGFHTVSTGTLQIRLHVVFQSQSSAMQYQTRRAFSAANRSGFDAYMSNIEDVLDTFHRAKQRALEVRETNVEMIQPNSTKF